MSVSLVQAAIRQIREAPDVGWFVGERSEELVALAEEALGFSLPASYRLFVRDLGAGSLGAEEVYGVVSSDFVDSAVPNGIWLTLSVRDVWGLPPTMLVVSFDGGVDYYVMDCSLEDPQLLLWRPGITASHDDRTAVAKNFGSFLMTLVEQELSAQPDA